MSVDDQQATAQLVAAIEAQLPSHDEINDVLEGMIAAGVSGSGPEISVPVVWLRILIDVLETRRMEVERNRMVFGARIAHLAGPTEFNRAYAIRSCAANIVDSILCARPGVTRDNLINSVVARLQLLPLASA